MDTEFCRVLTSLIQIWFYQHDSNYLFLWTFCYCNISKNIDKPWEKTHMKSQELVSHCEGSRPTLITTYYKFVCGTTLQIRVCIFWRLAVIQAAALLSNQSFFWHVDSSSSFLILPYVNRLNLWYMYNCTWNLQFHNCTQK